MKKPLSTRIRPNSEAAPWVIEEVRQLEAEIELLRDALGHMEHDSFTHGDTGAVCSGCDAVKALEASRELLP